MLTVPEAARRVGKNPETVRRWIREGKLTAHKVGTQHVIDELDLDAFQGPSETVPLPASWGLWPTEHSRPVGTSSA